MQSAYQSSDTSMIKKILFTLAGIGVAYSAGSQLITETVPQSITPVVCVASDPVTLGYEDALKNLTTGTTKQVIAQAVYSKDTDTTGTIYDIPDDATRMMIVVSRDLLTDKGNTDVIKVTSDWFNGSSWEMGKGTGGFTTQGGVRPDDCGSTALVSLSDTFLISLDGDSFIPTMQKGRKIRLHIVAKDNITTALAVYFKNDNAKSLGDLLYPTANAIVRHRTSPAGVECVTVTSCAIGFAGNNRPQSTIILHCRVGALGRTVTVTDDQSNTYIGQAGSMEAINATDGHTENVQWALNVKRATPTVTCAASGAATTMRVTVSEFSGIQLTGNVIDKMASTSGTGSAPGGISLTPTKPGSLVYCWEGNGSAADIQVAATWTFINRVPNSTSARIGTEYQIQTNTASAACAFVTSQTNWSLGEVVFKPAPEDPVVIGQ